MPATHNRSSRLPMSGRAMGGRTRGAKCSEAVQGPFHLSSNYKRPSPSPCSADWHRCGLNDNCSFVRLAATNIRKRKTETRAPTNFCPSSATALFLHTSRSSSSSGWPPRVITSQSVAVGSGNRLGSSSSTAFPQSQLDSRRADSCGKGQIRSSTDGQTRRSAARIGRRAVQADPKGAGGSERRRRVDRERR